jgi:hypothetical protein
MAQKKQRETGNVRRKESECMIHAEDVIAMLNREETQGQTEPFYQAVRDNLVRDLFDVAGLIWPTTALIKVKKMLVDPLLIRNVCLLIHGDAQTDGEQDISGAYIKARLDELSDEERQKVVAVTQRLLEETVSNHQRALVQVVGHGVSSVLH